MKIAIVGTSHLTLEETDNASNVIDTIINRYDEISYVRFGLTPEKLEIVTGDANGIDALILSCTDKCKVTMVKALDKKWEGKHGYKNRNILIAELVGYVYSISTQIKETRCYHCDTPNHERTGGCWTKRFAIDKLGKHGETIVI